MNSMCIINKKKVFWLELRYIVYIRSTPFVLVLFYSELKIAHIWVQTDRHCFTNVDLLHILDIYMYILFSFSPYESDELIAQTTTLATMCEYTVLCSINVDHLMKTKKMMEKKITIQIDKIYMHIFKTSNKKAGDHESCTYGNFFVYWNFRLDYNMFKCLSYANRPMKSTREVRSHFYFVHEWILMIILLVMVVFCCRGNVFFKSENLSLSITFL